MRKLYVGNLTFETTEADLRQMFEPHGAIESAVVATDRDTGRSRGFGFVEMSSNSEADAAMEALNGKEIGGRALTVNEARPKTSGGGGGRSGGYDGRRGNSGGGGAGRKTRW